MAPSLIVMVREAVVVSATHGCLYLLIHCTVGARRASIYKINTPNFLKDYSILVQSKVVEKCDHDYIHGFI